MLHQLHISCSLICERRVNGDSRQLQEVTFYPGIQVDRLRKTVKSRAGCILFISLVLNWVCPTCYYRNANTSL